MTQFGFRWPGGKLAMVCCRTATAVSREDRRMEPRTVEELMDLLRACRGTRENRGRVPADAYEHALRTAALLRRGRPADKELQVAGLVMHLGRHPCPGDPAAGADHAADAVRELLGARVAALVRGRPRPGLPAPR
ncbi:hypothetical protein HTV45_29705 [Streptomyces sp. CHD11]|nr:hypothetical protein [Streptomyces sp. CHD11]